MSAGNFPACILTILTEGGGLSMIRADAGNWTGGKVGAGKLRGTNYGIAASAHPTLDIAHLTKADAEAIYRREYWVPAGCEALPPGLDLMHFDGTVNAGLGRSRGWLAKAEAEAAGAPAIPRPDLHRRRGPQALRTRRQDRHGAGRGAGRAAGGQADPEQAGRGNIANLKQHRS